MSNFISVFTYQQAIKLKEILDDVIIQYELQKEEEQEKIIPPEFIKTPAIGNLFFTKDMIFRRDNWGVDGVEEDETLEDFICYTGSIDTTKYFSYLYNENEHYNSSSSGWHIYCKMNKDGKIITRNMMDIYDDLAPSGIDSPDYFSVTERNGSLVFDTRVTSYNIPSVEVVESSLVEWLKINKQPNDNDFSDLIMHLEDEYSIDLEL